MDPRPDFLYGMGWVLKDPSQETALTLRCWNELPKGINCSVNICKLNKARKLFIIQDSDTSETVQRVFRQRRVTGDWPLRYPPPHQSKRPWEFWYTPLVRFQVYEMSNPSFYPNYDHIVLKRFGLFHDSFPDVTAKKTTCPQSYHGALPPLTCRRTPRRPLMTFNSWEAPHFATKRREQNNT